MEEKNHIAITMISQIIPYLWVAVFSMIGGLVGYMNNINNNGVKFSIWRLIAELMTSGFVGFVTYLLCSYFQFDLRLTAVMVGISGHMGTRAIFKLERFWGKTFGMNDDNT